MYGSFVEDAFASFAGEFVHKMHQIGGQILRFLSLREVLDDLIGVFALLLVEVPEQLE